MRTIFVYQHLVFIFILFNLINQTKCLNCSVSNQPYFIFNNNDTFSSLDSALSKLIVYNKGQNVVILLKNSNIIYYVNQYYNISGINLTIS